MRKLLFLSTLVLTLLFLGGPLFAQDFSNQGKDFYLCFPAHVASTNNATLSIWITSDKASSGTVTMGNNAYSNTFNIGAYGMAEIQVPYSAAHISNAESNAISRKSIRIQVDPGKPAVVAYAQQWASARTDATLLLPVNVLGKKYYSINFAQNASAAGRSQFDIVATKDNTQIQITEVVNGVKGTVSGFTMQTGDVFQYQITGPLAASGDLTGTYIESVASPTGGCNPIAVFSGSSNVSIGTASCGSYNSSDPLMQQLYPISTWGKNFGYVPFANYPNGTPYRVLASEDNTNVYFNGSLVATLNAGQIYPNAYTSQPNILGIQNYITADKPICVAQYAQSSACNGLGNNQGDPDMVILNPIEQSIKDITIFSTKQQVIQTQWLNVLIKTAAVPSFKIARNTGALLPPSGTWLPFTPLAGYSCMQLLLPKPGTGADQGSNPTSDSYHLVADSGFNAICYGWGDNESYAYSAGTNVKDLYTQLGIATPYGSASSPSVCLNNASRFKISLPYQADSMFWDFHGAQTNAWLKTPQPLPYDSTTYVNGKQLWWYSLPGAYTFSTIGTYPVTITTYSPTGDCGTVQDIDFDVTVYPQPLADFTIGSTGCSTSPVSFTDNSNPGGRTPATWYWDFGDASNGNINNPIHAYGVPGTYTVKYSYITDIGCKADTASHLVMLTAPPTAQFASAGPYCAGKQISFTDQSTLSGGGTITGWFWDFGDASTSTQQNPTHPYALPGTYNVTLKTTSSTGCQSLGFTATVVVSPNPVADFSLPAGICLPAGTAQFNDLSTVVGAGNSIVNWAWNFGDPASGPANTSTQQNPTHNYGSTGPFNINIIVTTNNGCTDTKTQTLSAVFAEPQAAFTAPADVCLGSVASFTDNSTTASGTITGWSWDFGDPASGPNNTSTLQNPTHNYSTAGTYTVKLNVTTSNGCATVTKFATHTIVVDLLPTANFTMSALSCDNSPITFTSTSVANSGTITQYAWTVNGIPTGGNNPVLVYTPPLAGTYIITLTVQTDKGCSMQKTTTITVNPKPTADFATPSACLPSGVAHFTDMSSISSGNIVSWAWNFGDPGSGPANTSTQQNPTHTYSGPGPFNVTLTVTSNNGCTDTKVQVLSTIYPEPQAAFTTAPQICLGDNAIFTDNSTTASGTITGWTWDFGDGSPVSNLQNPTHPYAAAGTYTVTLNVTTSNGCTTVNKFATHTVVVNPLPTANFTASSPSCEGSTITLTSTSVANAGAITQYTWTVNGTPTGGNNPVITYTPPSAGTYTVILTIQTDKGCSMQKTTTLTVNAKPTADFSLPQVCLPSGIAQFNDLSTLTGGGTITNWSWNFGDPGSGPANTSTQQNPSHTYSGAGPYNVTLIVTSSNGCTDTKVQSLTTIYPEPQAAFTSPAEICLGAAANFTDNSTTASGTITSWNWDFGDANTSNQQNPTHTYLAAGTYTVKLNVTTSHGCSTVTKFATKTVIVDPLPTADFNTSLPGCVGSGVTFTDASAANANALITWTWDYGDGNSATLASGTPFTHVYGTPGSYNITLQVQTNKGCISTIRTKPVQINVRPQAGYISPQVCLSDPNAPFIDTSHISTGSIVGWNWTFGDPGSTPGNPNTSGLQNPTHGFGVPGPYTTRLIVTSNAGCKDTISQSFIVNGSIPVANFAMQNPPNTLCSNVPINLADASTVTFGSLIKVEVYWDFLNDPTNKTTDVTPAAANIYSHTYPEFGAPTTKTYRIKYVAYTGINCVNSTTKDITLLATPSLQFTQVPAVCSDALAFQLTEAQLQNGLPGTGVFSGTGVSATGLFSPAISGAGLYTIRYTYTGTNTCTNYAEQLVEVDATPAVNAGPDKVVLQGGVVALTPALNAGLPLTYLWSPSTGLNNPNIPNAVASPADDITYTLTVTSDKGCKSSDQVFVKVLKAPVIPNIFSPNGDGIHDKWEITSLESYPGCTVDIFNRYGQLIYHSVGYTQAWDGTINGKQAPIGTYYYIIDPKNGRQKASGYVDIIR